MHSKVTFYTQLKIALLKIEILQRGLFLHTLELENYYYSDTHKPPFKALNMTLQ